jgi:general secretion pathway protein A
VASSLTFNRFFAFFGLRENPFHVSPDPRFYYSSPGHDKAFTELVYSIETRQGITVLTGEAGTGKTTLVNRLLDWLRERNLSSAYVFHSLLRPSDLFEFIARDFGIPSTSSEKGALIEALHRWLVRRHAVGDIPVVIIDEAQALSSNTLDELRLLLNLETSGGKLIHIVLAGQPELDRKLQRHQLRQLRQRIMFRCRLPLLSVAQTSSYIAKRLSAAGLAEGTLFPEETVRALYGYARGIPRVINLLCEHALLNAYSDQHRRVSPSDIHLVAAKFDLQHDPIPAEDAFPMTTRMALFLSPDPSPANADSASLNSLHLETPQTDTPRPDAQQVPDAQQMPDVQQMNVQQTDTRQMDVQKIDAEQTTEILPIFPVSAPVPQITETILSLNPPLAVTPDPGPPPVGDPEPDPSPVSDPAPTEDPQSPPIQEPDTPVENDVAIATSAQMDLASPMDSGLSSVATPVADVAPEHEPAPIVELRLIEDSQPVPVQDPNEPLENAAPMAASSPIDSASVMDSDSSSIAVPAEEPAPEPAPMREMRLVEDSKPAPIPAAANPSVENTAPMAAPPPVDPVLAAESDSRAAEAPKRLAFAPKRMATPVEISATTPNHVAAARRHTVFGPTRAAFRPRQTPLAAHQSAVPPRPVATAAVASTPINRTRADQVSAPRRGTPASNKLAPVVKSLAAVSNQLANAGKQMASASKRVVPPQFVSSVSRYCRGVADSFMRDVRQWVKPSRSLRHGNPQRSAAADSLARPATSSNDSIVDNSSPNAAPGSSATPQKVVVSISKWLNEPMAPSLQDKSNPPPPNKSRAGRPANRSARRRR